MLLLDYQEDLSLQHSFENEDDSDPLITNDLNFDAMKSEQKKDARIQIATLSSYKYFGEGNYKMFAVKKMTAKTAFLEMPLKDRNCQVEPYEECRTRALLAECKEIMRLKVKSKLSKRR